MIEYSLKVKVLTENMALVTDNFELDVIAVQLHGSPAGHRHPER
jgi:hypothetical protein